MNKKLLTLTLGSMFLTILALFVVITKDAKNVYGEVAIGTQTISTTTPQLADQTNLCPANLTTASSTSGVLDSIYVAAPLTSDMLIMDATTTDATKRYPTATTSNIIVWLPAGTGTSTVHFGTKFSRGLIVDYGSGNATTTISYRCEGQNAR